MGDDGCLLAEQYQKSLCFSFCDDAPCTWKDVGFFPCHPFFSLVSRAIHGEFRGATSPHRNDEMSPCSTAWFRGRALFIDNFLSPLLVGTTSGNLFFFWVPAPRSADVLGKILFFFYEVLSSFSTEPRLTVPQRRENFPFF